MNTPTECPRCGCVACLCGTPFHTAPILRYILTPESGGWLAHSPDHPVAGRAYGNSRNEAIDMLRKNIATMYPVTDRHVEAVRAKLLARAAVGLRKYGVTTERTDYTSKDWLRELQHELLDAAVYLERLLGEEA